MKDKKTYPMMPVTQWWKLRDRFKKSMPGVVTDRYLSTVLNMKVESARANVLPPLKHTGIIDENGKPTDLANRWRDDKLYPGVCSEILEQVYPSELRDACPDPSKDRNSVERWFAQSTGAGTAAVAKIVAFYTLLCEADLSRAKIRGELKRKAKTQAPKPKHPMVTKGKVTKESSLAEPPATAPTAVAEFPDVRINLQIHISSDASPDQIDQIFSSIARHIYAKTTKS